MLDILYAYETEHWTGNKITVDQIKENDISEQIAEYENRFYKQRKELIKTKFKETGLTQKQLGMLLGYTSETYICTFFAHLINQFSNQIAYSDESGRAFRV